jgi:hypothetical protein
MADYVIGLADVSYESEVVAKGALEVSDTEEAFDLAAFPEPERAAPIKRGSLPGSTESTTSAILATSAATRRSWRA